MSRKSLVSKTSPPKSWCSVSMTVNGEHFEAEGEQIEVFRKWHAFMDRVFKPLITIEVLDDGKH